MSAEDRLERLVKESVEADLQGLELPVDLADRVISSGRRRRAWQRFPLVPAIAATAAVVVIVPLAVRMAGSASDGPSADPSKLTPSAIVPSAAVVPPNLAGVTPRGCLDRFVVTSKTAKVRTYRARCGRPGKTAVILVYTGSMTYSWVLREANVRASAADLVVVDRGEAVIADVSGVPGRPTWQLVWEQRPGLILRVVGAKLTKNDVISIAKGIEIR